MTERSAVLGIGNPLSHEDAIGLIVAEKVARLLNWEVLHAHTTGLEIVDVILPYRRVLVIDTIAGKNSGEVEIFFPRDCRLQIQYSHSLGILETLSIGKTLMGDEFPECMVVGVGSKNFRGDDESVDKTVKKIISIVKRYPDW